ncbi:hypothetical protein DL770_007917 [Monosporascus sp. CRB-9-2]|nr:hypothetical protein DL770_007917 [Monosporascus sp. CRB-9-2]
MQLEEAIKTRHSSRQFLADKEVPRAVLEQALQLATHAPSNSNTQAWRLFVVRGAALTRLRTALYDHAAAPDAPPPAAVTELPPALQAYRSELGALLYGELLGLARSDAAGRRAALLRNYRFFNAPVGVIACMSADLPGEAALCVGMYLQTLLLALTEAGVGSCVQIAIAGYPDVVRREVGIPADLDILCGISVGYEDEAAAINRGRIGREPVERTTVWVEE